MTERQRHSTSAMEEAMQHLFKVPSARSDILLFRLAPEPGAFDTPPPTRRMPWQHFVQDVAAH